MNKLQASMTLSPDEIQGTMDELFLRSKRFPEPSMQAVITFLDTLRLNCSREEWESIAKSITQHHSLSESARNAVLPRRAFAKPRGYAGDAVMIDFIYDRTPTDSTDEWLCRLDEWVYETQACRAVRSRRASTAASIDSLTSEFPRVLSFACGHLREAEDSVRVANHGFSEFIAVDQDPESLGKVDGQFRQLGIVTRWGTVGQAIRETQSFGKFDLIYATGLYDYLSNETAKALTAAFCRMLTPGGKVILVNFAPTLTDIGWMEGIMDWWLIYRSAAQMEQLVPRGDPGLTASTSLDDLNALAYLTVTKSQ